MILKKDLTKKSYMFLIFVMNTKVVMSKNTALERIESHEKLCRIMQKQTHQKINNIESEIKDIKKHLYYAMSALIGGMFTIIVILFEKL
jgi:hypothetical protein